MLNNLLHFLLFSIFARTQKEQNVNDAGYAVVEAKGDPVSFDTIAGVSLAQSCFAHLAEIKALTAA